MKQYRGYYIDHIVFSSEAEIDAAIKAQAIDRYKMMCRMFADNGSMELNVIMINHADYMHTVCGMDYNEIEAIEIEVFAA